MKLSLCSYNTRHGFQERHKSTNCVQRRPLNLVGHLLLYLHKLVYNLKMFSSASSTDEMRYRSDKMQQVLEMPSHRKICLVYSEENVPNAWPSLRLTQNGMLHKLGVCRLVLLNLLSGVRIGLGLLHMVLVVQVHVISLVNALRPYIHSTQLFWLERQFQQATCQQIDKSCTLTSSIIWVGHLGISYPAWNVGFQVHFN